MPRQKHKKHRTLLEEIEQTEQQEKDHPNETVPVPLRILRSLYLHALYACRDGDYKSVSEFYADLTRRDKHIKNMKHPSLDTSLHQATIPTPPEEQPRRVGFEDKVACGMK